MSDINFFSKTISFQALRQARDIEVWMWAVGPGWPGNLPWIQLKWSEWSLSPLATCDEKFVKYTFPLQKLGVFIFSPGTFHLKWPVIVSQKRQFQQQTCRLKARWEHSPGKWLTLRHGYSRSGHVTNRDFESPSLLGFWKTHYSWWWWWWCWWWWWWLFFAPSVVSTWMFRFILRHKQRCFWACGSCDSIPYDVSRLKGAWILCVRMSPLPEWRWGLMLGCCQSRGGVANKSKSADGCCFFLVGYHPLRRTSLDRGAFLASCWCIPTKTHGNKKSSWGFIAMDQIVILRICFGWTPCLWCAWIKDKYYMCTVYAYFGSCPNSVAVDHEGKFLWPQPNSDEYFPTVSQGSDRT